MCAFVGVKQFGTFCFSIEPKSQIPTCSAIVMREILHVKEKYASFFRSEVYSLI